MPQTFGAAPGKVFLRGIVEARNNGDASRT